MPPQYSKSLTYSLYDGCAHAVMVGMGETFIMTFAVTLGYSNFNLGLISSVPVFLAVFLQVLLLDRSIRFHSRKILTFRFVLLQALLWIPIFYLPFTFRPYPFILLALLVLYHSCSHLASPVWNSWMGDIVPAEIRGSYFGTRNKYRSVFELTSFLIAGLILYFFSSTHVFWGFGIIFLVAFAARMVSAFFLHKVEEPVYQHSSFAYFSFFTFMKKSLRNNFGRFVMLTGVFLAVTNIASPFFTAYMLRALGFTYLELTVAMAVTLLFQFFSFQSWGLIGDRFGNLKILKITSVGASFLPLLWLTTNNFWIILLFQALAGILWSGFNLATINYIFDAVTKQKLSRCMAYYNFIVNTGIAMGALVGGALSKLPLQLFDSLALPVAGQLNIYHFLFMASSLARMLVAAIMWFVIREVRTVMPHTTWSVIRHFVEWSLTPEFGNRFVNIFVRKKPDE